MVTVLSCLPKICVVEVSVQMQLLNGTIQLLTGKHWVCSALVSLRVTLAVDEFAAEISTLSALQAFLYFIVAEFTSATFRKKTDNDACTSNSGSKMVSHGWGGVRRFNLPERVFVYFF